MSLRHLIKTALLGLRRHPSRSTLTILGITIGITAVILIVSLGQGAKDLVLEQIQGLGSKTIIVIPGREPRGPTDVAQTLFSDSLREKDLEAIKTKSNVPSSAVVMPVVFGGSTAAVASETYRMTVIGGTDQAAAIFDLRPVEGVFFSEEEVRGKQDVAVIGAKVKKELFGPSDALGQKIKLKNRNFRIVGVLPQKGQVSFFNFDEIVIVPYTTAQQYLFGIKYFHRIIIQAESDETVAQTVSDIKATLRSSHEITDPAKDDFFVETQADIANRLGVITNILTIFLASVAAISLLVGGIGIMNIMLVAVTERTREIGLRKAVGATNRDILIQFLLEAMLLTLTGGIIGILAGALISFGASIILQKIVAVGWSFAFPISAALLGLAVAAFVGLVFGIYPASQAARKNPIESLRYE